MQFGWLTLAVSPSPEEDAQRIQDQIEQVQYAEQLGFHDAWLTEHYFTGESVYNDAIVFAAALAMKTERIRLGFAVVQMPFHHPVRLATQLALLDNLSGGRVDVGVGKGTLYNEYEFIGHGLRSDDNRARMEEGLDLLQRCWTSAPFQFDGRYHQVAVPAIRPKPVQAPHPPLWRSAVSPSSFLDCGRAGIPVMTARLPVTALAERWALYEQGMEEGGLPEGQRAALRTQAALWRNVYVGESQAEAEDTLARVMAESRQHMMHVREDLNPPDFEPDPAFLNPWTDPTVSDAEAVPFTLETGTIYGTAKQVQEQVAEIRDAGVQHLLCQTSFGDMSQEHSLASMRRFGEDVMPAFR